MVLADMRGTPNAARPGPLGQRGDRWTRRWLRRAPAILLTLGVALPVSWPVAAAADIATQTTVPPPPSSSTTTPPTTAPPSSTSTTSPTTTTTVAPPPTT